MSDEEWRSVAGWEGLYEVSDHGQVRSLPRLVPSGWGSKSVRGGKMLNAHADKDGYLRVVLTNGTYKRTRTVHRIVLEAFVQVKPPGTEARHLNGICTDNRPGNLAWGTHRENIRDRGRHGTLSWALDRGYCKNGHPFNTANTYINPNGSPTCRVCRREGMRRYAARKKKEA